jgi:hypothetical protein
MINLQSILILLSALTLLILTIRYTIAKYKTSMHRLEQKKLEETKYEELQSLYNKLHCELLTTKKEATDAHCMIQQLYHNNELEHNQSKLKHDIVLEQLLEYKKNINSLSNENEQLETRIHEMEEQSEKMRHDLENRALQQFDWRAEMGYLRESLVKHHVCPAEHFKPGFRMPLPTYVDDVIQTIVDSIQEIEKIESIMNMFYCSFDDFEFGEPVPNTMVYPGIQTYAKVYLITTKSIYELQGYFKGKPWPKEHYSQWDAYGIYLRSANKQYEVKNLEYGTFYRFHPIADVHPDVNWLALSMMINATKGNIGKAVNQTYVLSTSEDNVGINMSSGRILDETAKRYIINITKAVTMTQ